jgi:hypothetical protein
MLDHFDAGFGQRGRRSASTIAWPSGLGTSKPSIAPLVSNRRVPFAANAKLDPKLPCTKLVKAWRLWIPPTWVRSPVGKGETVHD